MIKYTQLHLSAGVDVTAASASGAMMDADDGVHFVAWQPSTWPHHDQADAAFVETLKTILEQSMLLEIQNVIDDARLGLGASLEHRGHVVGLALFVALEAVASLGYNDQFVAEFVRAHFPPEYRPFADELYPQFRCDLAHCWNLFAGALVPDDSAPRRTRGVIVIGILHFFDALKESVLNFLNALADHCDAALLERTLANYNKRRARARPLPRDPKPERSA